MQRLYGEEEQPTSTSMNGKERISPRETDDKDIVECLENVVQHWTDYSKVHYHPRSLYELTGLWMEGQEFDNYGIGREALSGGSRGEEISERIRSFVEECDHIQVCTITTNIVPQLYVVVTAYKKLLICKSMKPVFLCRVFNLSSMIREVSQP